MGWVAAIATIGGAYMNYKATKEQRKYEQDQRQVQIRSDALNARREKINAYREYLRAQADAQQIGAYSGTSGWQTGSSYQGARSSLSSQYAANAGFANEYNSLMSYGNNMVNKASRYKSYGDLFSATASLAGNTFGGYSEVRDMSKSMFR